MGELVAAMLRDRKRTRFVAVCIAEGLSVAETQRLLAELKTEEIRASHVVVNQLLPSGSESLKTRLGAALSSTNHAGLLADANEVLTVFEGRRRSQDKHLKLLKNMPEVRNELRVVEMQLQAGEVTGFGGLYGFGKQLVSGRALTQKPDIVGSEEVEVSALDELSKAQKEAKAKEIAKAEKKKERAKKAEIEKDARRVKKEKQNKGTKKEKSDKKENGNPKKGAKKGMPDLSGLMNGMGGDLGDMLKNLDADTIKKGMDMFGLNADTLANLGKGGDEGEEEEEL